MRLVRRWSLVVLVVFALVGAMAPLAKLQAQDNTTIISVAVPNFMRESLNDELLAAFTSQHPGVQVNVLRYDNNVPPLTGGLDNHLAAVQALTSAADVVYIDAQRTSISPAATRA